MNIVSAFGDRRLVLDLAADDFQALRASLAKRYGIHRLGNSDVGTLPQTALDLEKGWVEYPLRLLVDGKPVWSGQNCLRSDSCTPTHDFAPRCLQTPPRDDALAVR